MAEMKNGAEAVVEGRRTRRGGFFALLVIAYRNIYRNRRRSVLCVVAIAVTVFFIIALAALMDGMMDTFRKQIITYESGHILVSSAQYEKKSLFMPLQYPLELPGKDLPELVRELEQIPRVARAFPRIKTRVSILNSTTKSALLWGIDMEEELAYNVFNYKTRNAGKCLVEGRYPLPDANECAVGFRLARAMGVQVGDKIQMRMISAEFSDKYYSPVIVGIMDLNFSEMDKNAVVIPFSRAQRLASLAGRTQVLTVYLKDINAADAVSAELQRKYAGYQGLSIKPYTRHPYLTLLKSSEIMMVIIYAVFMVVASFLIVNTVIMVIHERIKEIGMMAALGMTRREIVEVFFLESLVLSGLGSAMGGLAGGVTTYVLSRIPFDIGSIMESMMATNNTLYVTFSPAIIVQGLLFGLVVSGVCTILPSLKSAFVKPVEAIRR
jgi:putative ABC transport system permease protein